MMHSSPVAGSVVISSNLQLKKEKKKQKGEEVEKRGTEKRTRSYLHYCTEYLPSASHDCLVSQLPPSPVLLLLLFLYSPPPPYYYFCLQDLLVDLCT